jgi:hypothetical protein
MLPSAVINYKKIHLMAAKKKASGRGGWRPGAGAKPLPPSERRRRPVIVALTDAQFAKLDRIAKREGYLTGAMAYLVVSRWLDRQEG